MRLRLSDSRRKPSAELYSGGGGGQLPVRRRLRRRVPRVPVRLQLFGLRAAGHGRRSEARAGGRQRVGRGRDRRSRRTRRTRLDRGAAERARPLSRPPLGTGVARERGVARLLAQEAGLPRRLARSPRQGRTTRGRLGRRRRRFRLPRSERRSRAAGARARPVLARAAVPALIRAGLIAAYLAALLAVDTQVDLRVQLVLGALTWLVLLIVARPLPPDRRAQVAVVICAATVAELTG